VTVEIDATIPGRRTSEIRQSASQVRSESKNSSAEANTLTSRRADRISLSSDLRTETFVVHC
jgi:hypothetical protein